eukprot:920865-Rhodomonas_salina.1
MTVHPHLPDGGGTAASSSTDHDGRASEHSPGRVGAQCRYVKTLKNSLMFSRHIHVTEIHVTVSRSVMICVIIEYVLSLCGGGAPVELQVPCPDLGRDPTPRNQTQETTSPRALAGSTADAPLEVRRGHARGTSSTDCSCSMLRVLLLTRAAGPA